ncbi:MAG: hypothetical protein HQL68_03520 [Magnetococcales bacterium]|nr:hypothetical protein [Magnetococcales bacterium]
MQPSKRSTRRHHMNRMKRKARRTFPDDPMAHILANHMQFCSRVCCNAKRRRAQFGEKAIEEIKAEDWARVDFESAGLGL